MTEFIRTVLQVCLLTVVAMAAWAAEPMTPVDDLTVENFVDRYPSDVSVAGGSLLFGHGKIAKIIKQILPPEELALLKQYKVESPFQSKHGYLVAGLCMPHNCPNETASVVIDEKTFRVFVQFFLRTAHRASDREYGEDDNFPDEISGVFGRTPVDQNHPG